MTTLCVCVNVVFSTEKTFAFENQKKKIPMNQYNDENHTSNIEIFFSPFSFGFNLIIMFVCVWVVITQEKRKKIPIWYIDRYMIVVFGHHCHIYIYAHTFVTTNQTNTHTQNIYSFVLNNSNPWIYYRSNYRHINGR